MDGPTPDKETAPQPTNEGDHIQIGNIQHAQAVAIGAGATAVYQGLTIEEVAALVIELKNKDQPTVWNGRIPYLGLSAFQESDAHFFFGRESLITELLERVKIARFIVIAGPSGSGKSSVARAGLFHALREGRLNKSNNWLLATMQPKGNPFLELATAIDRMVGKPNAGDYLRENGRSNPLALQEQIEPLLSDDPQQRCVILVDQFEETFTQTQAEDRVPFVDLLTEAAGAKNGRVTIILSLRADFVSHCAHYPNLRALMSQQFQLVGAMDPPDLVKAITLPALEVGAEIDHAIVSRIMVDMKGEPGALPLMSFALQDLFDAEKTTKGEPLALTLPGYLDRGGIESALERHADKAFARLTNTQKQLARVIFTKLIAVGQGRVETRRTAVFSELVPAGVDKMEVMDVVYALAEDGVRLITTSSDATANGNTGERTITLIHEKLIDAWPWLRQLVDENREKIVLQNQINDDAQVWENEKSQDFLYRGKQLIQKEYQIEMLQPVLNPLSQQFIQASRDFRKTEMENQRVRRLRELAAKRRIQVGSIIIFSVLIIALWLGSSLAKNIWLGRCFPNCADKIINFEEGNEIANSRRISFILSGLDLTDAYLVGADFRGANLRGANLSNTNLSRADLSNANLIGATFSENTILEGAKLQGAQLYGTNLNIVQNMSGIDLQAADLSDITLTNVNFISATLNNIILSKSDLSHANLSYANLSYAELILANLRNADFGYADLSSANLSSANLSDANLAGANLTNANLRNSSLINADLNSAILTGSDLTDANLSQVNFQGVVGIESAILDEKWRQVIQVVNQGGMGQDMSLVDLSDANLIGINLSHANLSNANLMRANLNSASLNHANLTHANLSFTSLGNANLSSTQSDAALLVGADLRGTNLHDAHLNNADLRNADLSNADLSNADLRNADLSNADLSNADLSNADLSNADLSNANLSNADLDGANLLNAILDNEPILTGARLNQANLEGTYGDGSARMDAKWQLVWKIVNRELDAQALNGVDLSNAYLSGTDLRGYDINNVDFSNANLSHANLSNADLSYTNLSGTDLSYATLNNSTLNNSILTNTVLSNASLRYARLNQVDLSRVDLSYTDLSHADLNDVTLNNSTLNATNFSSASLDSISLSYSTLSDAVFRNSDLNNANLASVTINNADFFEADLSNANLSAANLSNVDLSRSILNGANLADSLLSNVNLSGADLSSTDLNHVDLSGIQLDNNTIISGKWRLVWEIVTQAPIDHDLSEADLSEAILNGANLSGTNLSGANLSGAILNNANLGGADLSRVNLSGTELFYANLRGANLLEVDLNLALLLSTDLRDADLSGANLSAVFIPSINITGAMYNEETKWPLDFNSEEFNVILLP